jgi:hypothetical protein
MGRPLRIEYPGALYHLTNRGNERKKIFRDDSDKAKFLEILEEYHDLFGILLHGYVLMDNNYLTSANTSCTFCLGSLFYYQEGLMSQKNKIRKTTCC